MDRQSNQTMYPTLIPSTVPPEINPQVTVTVALRKSHLFGTRCRTFLDSKDPAVSRYCVVEESRHRDQLLHRS